MSLEVTGVLLDVKPIESRDYNGKVYHKRNFIITEKDGEYPQSYKLEVDEKLMNVLDNFNLGQVVTCKYNLRGKAYSDKDTGELKCFNTMKCWAINAANSEPQQVATYTPPQQNYPSQNQSSVPGLNNPNPEEDGLPF